MAQKANPCLHIRYQSPKTVRAPQLKKRYCCSIFFIILTHLISRRYQQACYLNQGFCSVLLSSFSVQTYFLANILRSFIKLIGARCCGFLQMLAFSQASFIQIAIFGNIRDEPGVINYVRKKLTIFHSFKSKGVTSKLPKSQIFFTAKPFGLKRRERKKDERKKRKQSSN